jgi:hypothetical protein
MPKYYSLPITSMTLASLVDIAMLIIYHRGTEKISDWNVLVFRETCFL